MAEPGCGISITVRARVVFGSTSITHPFASGHFCDGGPFQRWTGLESLHSPVTFCFT